MSEPESGPKSEPPKPLKTALSRAEMRQRVLAGVILAATFITSMIISKISGDTATEQSTTEEE